MNTKVFLANSLKELEVEFRNNISDGYSPTLAIVFCSVVQPLEQVRSFFANNHIPVFGCTSSGEIMNSDFIEEGITVMLLDFPQETFKIKLFDGMAKSSYQLGQGVAVWVNAIYERPALLILSAGLQADGEALVNGVIESLTDEVPLFGGLAGDDLKMQGTYAFTEAETTGMGVLVLAIDNSKIEVEGLAVSGWKGIGTIKTITKSEGNVVQMIDDQPALDVYSRYLNIGGDHTLAAEYPLLVMREDGTYVLRAAMLINPDKSMVYAGSVPQGSKVQFSVPPSNEIIDITIENLNQFIQPDTIVPDPRIPADWNKYTYVRNNPVNYIDPSGHGPIHFQVIIRYALRDGLEVEQVIPSTVPSTPPLWPGQKRGKRVDLVDYLTSQIWEVEPYSASGNYPKGHGPGQVDTYLDLLNENTNKWLPGRWLRPMDFTFGPYDVNAWWEQPGLIVFRTRLNQERVLVTTTALCLVGISQILQARQDAQQWLRDLLRGFPPLPGSPLPESPLVPIVPGFPPPLIPVPIVP